MHQPGLAARSKIFRCFWTLSLLAVALGCIPGPVAAQTSNLVFSSVTNSGSNLIVSGSGGLAGAGYYLMGSTNLGVPPLASWSMISTNVFAANGQFTDSIPIDPTIPQDFFIISAATSVPDTQPPSVPSNLVATPISSNQINLNWIASTDNVGVTGYLLEQSPGVGQTNFAQIATPAATN